jgi:pimeloyl-ACP methyl ester carboxylesterase
VILDGAVPVDLALGPDAAPQAQKALDALFDRCSADPACSAAFPRAREQFNALRARLQRERIQAQLPDPIDAQLAVTSFGPAELSAAVRLLTYSDETASVLPLLIHEAQTLQQPQALVAQYLMIKHSADTQIAYGMHFAVVCSEDAPRWSRENISAAALSATFMGSDFMAGMKAICEVWPRGPVDEDFNAPLVSDTPALILSGSNDPVTPPAYGERALRSFKNGRHLVLAGQGHGQLANGCMPRVIAQFIEEGVAAKLDVRCLANITPAPFMLSRTATAP